MYAMKRILCSLLLAASCLAAAPAHAFGYEPKVGIQSWTLRNMDFDQVVEFAKKHKIRNLELIAKHIDPMGPLDEAKRRKAILDKNGLTCYSFGVAGTSMDKEQNRKLFEFAKLMKIKVIIVEPKNMAEWDNLEALVKEYNIKLAVHNHGITTPYGNPATVQKILDSRDKRIGVCLDIGHVTGAGFDAAKVFHDYNGRVYDIHLKDKHVVKKDGKEQILDVEIGTGDANYDGVFAELKKAGWKGVMAIETDNNDFAKSPDDYVSKAIDFVKEKSHGKKK